MATTHATLKPAALPAVMNERLAEIRRRESILRLRRGLIDALALFLAVMLVALLVDWTFNLFDPEVRQILTFTSLGAGVLGLIAFVLLPQLRRRNLNDLAAQVDRSVASLEERWETVTEITTSSNGKSTTGSPAMLKQVMKEAVAADPLVDARAVVRGNLRKHAWILGAVVAAHLFIYTVDGPRAWVLFKRFWAPTTPVSLTQVTAKSGDMTVPRGEKIRLEASVDRRPQDKTTLYIRNAQGEVTETQLSAANAERTQFLYSVAAATENFDYRFRSGDGETGWNSVSVYDRPKLTGVDFRITSPEYTKVPPVEKNELPAKTRAVEGSLLELSFKVDQPLENFKLELDKDKSVMLEADKTDPLRYSFRQVLKDSLRLSPQFVSKYGLENKRLPSSQIIVYQDKAPQVTIVTPDKEISVHSDEVVEIEWNARDDFGVTRAEVIAYVGEAPDMANAVTFPIEQGDETGPAKQKGQTTDPHLPSPAPSSQLAPPDNEPADKGRSPKGEEPAAEQEKMKIPRPAGEPSTENVPNVKNEPQKGGSNDKKVPATTGDGQNANAPKGLPNSNGESTAPQPTDAKPGDPKAADAKPSDAKPGDGKPGDGTPAPQAKMKENDPAKAAGGEGGTPKPGMPKDQNSAKPSPSLNEMLAPKTARIPIPLNEATGDKAVKGKVKLDLSKFQLKQGEQIQYMVRVYDSRNTTSNGQAYSGQQQTSQNGENANGNNPSQNNNGDPSGQQANAADGKQQGGPSDATTSKDGKAQPRDGQSKMDPATAIADASKNGAQNNATKNGAQNNATKMGAQGEANKAGSQNSGTNGDKNAANPNEKNGANASKTQDQLASNSQGGKPDTSRATVNPSDNSGQNQSGQGGEQNSSNNQKDNQQPNGENSGSQPPNPMNMRNLDVEQESQASASSTMKITIDEFAGSFDAQQRAKLEIVIDPVLKELDAVLVKALEHMKPVSAAFLQAKPLDDEIKKSLRGSETQIERAQSLVADLVKKTDGTPYAFIGLQLVDITELHISPAKNEVKLTSADPEDKRKGHSQQAEFHLNRARELLKDLTRAYESAKRDAQLAEDMQRIKRMYQIFVEDALTALGSSKSPLNSKNRKMAELELDEEFLKKYEELQKQWQETLKELAKALAKDPRLLERYMNASRKSADSLRDQITLLNNRQKDLAAPVDHLLATPTPAKPADDKKDATKESRVATLLKANQVRDIAEISKSLASVQEDFKTWMPKAANADDPKIKAVTEQTAQVAAAAGIAMDESLKPENAATATKKTEELSAEVKTLEERLVALTTGAGDDSPLVPHANRRLSAVRKAQQNITAWIEKDKHLKNGEFHKVVELDQHQLAEDTLSVSDKLENLQAQLAGLPADVLDLADEIKQTMRFDVLVDQMNAELKLRDSDLPGAKENQQRALEGLARAESQFDKMFDRIIEEQDKVPPQVPDIDNAQLQTLEELLARLEGEEDLAELLGLPERPNNLQALQDWMMRGSSGQQMAQSMRSSANQGAQMAERARQQALRAMKKKNDPKQEGNLNTAKARRWNTLSSRLDDVLRQGRGNLPPKQYRQAIEKYFETISGAEGTAENTPAPTKPADPAAPKTEGKQ